MGTTDSNRSSTIAGINLVFDLVDAGCWYGDIRQASADSATVRILADILMTRAGRRHEIRHLPISKFVDGLGMRTFNTLVKEFGNITLDQLADKGETSLLDIRNFGSENLKKVKELLAIYDLELQG